MTRLNPYISFKDNTREAMEFYHKIFGGKLDITTFKEGKMSQDPSTDNLIMHAMLETDNGLTFMASDTPPGMEYKPVSGISISLSGEDEKELRGYWDKLLDGAIITLPLEKSPWNDYFGMLIDKFGVPWMVNISIA